MHFIAIGYKRFLKNTSDPRQGVPLIQPRLIYNNGVFVLGPSGDVQEWDPARLQDENDGQR